MHIESARPRSRLITLTPLIDVVFILLVFFMLASTFLDWQGIEIDLSSASSTEALEDDAWLVRVELDGVVNLNGERLTLDSLTDRVRHRIQARPDQAIIIQPLSNSIVQSLVHVLDELAAAGVVNISITR